VKILVELMWNYPYVILLVFLYPVFGIVNQLTKVSLNSPQVGSQLLATCKHRTIELAIYNNILCGIVYGVMSTEA